MRIAICRACMPPIVTKKRSGEKGSRPSGEGAAVDAASYRRAIASAAPGCRAGRCRRSRPPRRDRRGRLADEGRRRQVAFADPERDQALPVAAVVEDLDDAALGQPPSASAPQAAEKVPEPAAAVVRPRAGNVHTASHSNDRRPRRDGPTGQRRARRSRISVEQHLFLGRRGRHRRRPAAVRGAGTGSAGQIRNSTTATIRKLTT